MIGLAVGKKAVAYGPEVGTVSGEEVMQAYFRDDLGFGSEFSAATEHLYQSHGQPTSGN